MITATSSRGFRASSPRILIADDDPGVLAALATRLRGRFRVVTVGDGEALLEELDAEGPMDLLVIDLVMPRVGGGQALAALRARGDTTPVIAMSGDGHRLDEARALGADETLTKPFGLGALEEKIDRLLFS
jgi:DNA-binding response OmpR family regulator